MVLDGPNLLHLGYHFGINPVQAVVKAGRIVHRVEPPVAGSRQAEPRQIGPRQTG